jgi:hypothetical protein
MKLKNFGLQTESCSASVDTVRRAQIYQIVVMPEDLIRPSRLNSGSS